MHGILIRPSLTIWQAMIVLDPTFPRSARQGKWERIPTIQELIDALRWAAFFGTEEKVRELRQSGAFFGG